MLANDCEENNGAWGKALLIENTKGQTTSQSQLSNQNNSRAGHHFG